MEERDPLISIAGRCSGEAWDRLKEIREHPLCAQVIEALQYVEGTIFEFHVEGVFAQLLRGYDDRSEGSAVYPRLH